MLNPDGSYADPQPGLVPAPTTLALADLANVPKLPSGAGHRTLERRRQSPATHHPIRTTDGAAAQP